MPYVRLNILNKCIAQMAYIMLYVVFGYRSVVNTDLSALSFFKLVNYPVLKYFVLRSDARTI